MSTISLRTQIREDHLTCSICFNNFIKPKALPCLHTFCEDCLRDYIVSRGYEATGCFPCPVCRKSIDMPREGINGFPDNHLMSSLSDTVEKLDHRPIPKPRRSLGQTKPVEESSEASGRSSELPSYSSVADTNPGFSDTSKAKICANDTEPDWMIVPRHSPLAPNTSSEPSTAEYCVVSKSRGGEEATSADFAAFAPSSGLSHRTLSNQANISNSMGVPNQPSANYSQPGGANIPGLPPYSGPLPQPSGERGNAPTIGWNLNALDNMESRLGMPPGLQQPNENDRPFNTHSPRDSDNTHIKQARTVSPVLYPTVPSNVEHSNTACTENLMLRFGKQGSSVRDFLKPVGLSVSAEGNYIVSDNGGDQNRIFIFNSAGELTTAFKSGCKVKDITVSKKNDILAAVHKNVCAIRHFTMAGQCKGEYGKFFTFEVPCGIAELNNGGVVLTGTQNHCVYVLTDQMKLATKFGRKGNGDGYFQHPAYCAVNSKNHILVTDKVNNCIQEFGVTGKIKQRFGSTGNGHGHLNTPLGICVDKEDNIIVADSGNHRVEVFSPRGSWLNTIVKNTHELGDKVKPVNVAMTPTGKVAVLLRGPYFAEVRVYSSKHHQIQHHDKSVSNTSATWYTHATTK